MIIIIVDQDSSISDIGKMTANFPFSEKKELSCPTK